MVQQWQKKSVNKSLFVDYMAKIFVLNCIYSSNKIRKGQYEHRSIVCQNLNSL